MGLSGRMGSSGARSEPRERLRSRLRARGEERATDRVEVGGSSSSKPELWPSSSLFWSAPDSVDNDPV